jgi:uncharacterized Tic20 family protein
MQAISRDERTWAMIAHLSPLVGYAGIPFGNIVPPLIIWLVKKDQSWFVGEQAKESLNFQISMFIYAMIGVVLMLGLMLVLIGTVLLIILYVFGIVMIIVAAINANNGVQYRYPITIRFIK